MRDGTELPLNRLVKGILKAFPCPLSLLLWLYVLPLFTFPVSWDPEHPGGEVPGITRLGLGFKQGRGLMGGVIREKFDNVSHLESYLFHPCEVVPLSEVDGLVFAFFAPEEDVLVLGTGAEGESALKKDTAGNLLIRSRNSIALPFGCRTGIWRNWSDTL